eukprot:1008505-Alexandrium_andersonii.AAC.1
MLGRNTPGELYAGGEEHGAPGLRAEHRAPETSNMENRAQDCFNPETPGKCWYPGAFGSTAAVGFSARQPPGERDVRDASDSARVSVIST